MKRNSELIFLLHVFIFSIISIFLFKIYDYNVFKYIENSIDKAGSIMKQEILLSADYMYNDSDNPTADTLLEIEEYKMSSINVVDEAVYTMKYYMPAFIAIFLIILMNVEFYIFDNLKLFIKTLTYDKEKDHDSQKMKMLIKEKFKLKLKRITLPRHITAVYIFAVFINMIFNFQNELLSRAISNFIFIGTMLITIFGIRLVINFFRTNSSILRAIIICLNVFMGMLYPQIYFIIGFLESIMNIKIVVRKINK